MPRIRPYKCVSSIQQDYGISTINPEEPNRFAVDVSFIDPNIKDPEVDPEGTATVASSLRTPNTGFFWFFNQENIELAVKVLDGRGINGRFWLLYGALSDVEYEITVTDTMTKQSKMYRNEAGSICGEVDTLAF